MDIVPYKALYGHLQHVLQRVSFSELEDLQSMDEFGWLQYTELTKWEKVSKPKAGRELINGALFKALEDSKVEFTEAEWDAFKISDAGHDSYIKVGDTYFQPAVVEKQTVKGFDQQELMWSANFWSAADRTWPSQKTVKWYSPPPFTRGAQCMRLRGDSWYVTIKWQATRATSARDKNLRTACACACARYQQDHMATFRHMIGRCTVGRQSRQELANHSLVTFALPRPPQAVP